MIDPRSELTDVLDSILRDLGQVVRYDQVRILLLPSVLDFQKDASIEGRGSHAVDYRARERRIGDAAGFAGSRAIGTLSAESLIDDLAEADRHS